MVVTYNDSIILKFMIEPWYIIFLVTQKGISTISQLVKSNYFTHLNIAIYNSKKKNHPSSNQKKSHRSQNQKNNKATAQANSPAKFTTHI